MPVIIPNNYSTAVNNKNGRLTNERSERLKIWKEHFDTEL